MPINYSNFKNAPSFSTFPAKKSLGQNFLTDLNIAKKIVNEINLAENDIVLEIGPGFGILTLLIQPKVHFLYAVEIDKRLCEFLEHKIKADNFMLFQTDFLDMALSTLKHSNIRLVGNIPYHITSPILFKVLENQGKIRDMILLVQKEVGKRILADSNTKDYGILSVISQTYTQVTKLLTVRKTVFYPRPKVDSLLIRWHFTNMKSKYILNHRIFRQVVRLAFGQRRKMLRNSLKKHVDLNTISEPYLTRRPEELTIDEWILLSNNIKQIENCVF